MRQFTSLSESLQGEYEDKKPLLSFTPSHVHLMAQEIPWKFFRHIYHLTAKTIKAHNYTLVGTSCPTKLTPYILIERQWDSFYCPFIDQSIILSPDRTGEGTEVISNFSKLADNTYLAHWKNPEKYALIFQIQEDILVVDVIRCVGSFCGQKFKQILKRHPYYLPLKSSDHE